MIIIIVLSFATQFEIKANALWFAKYTTVKIKDLQEGFRKSAIANKSISKKKKLCRAAMDHSEIPQQISSYCVQPAWLTRNRQI